MCTAHIAYFCLGNWYMPPGSILLLTHLLYLSLDGHGNRFM